MHIRRFLLVAVIIPHLLCAQIPPSHAQEITKATGRYHRQYTVLEIGKGDCPYLTELSLSRAVGAAVLLEGDADTLVRKVKDSNRPLSVMAPPKLTIRMLETLGRCEHFDVVIVHDISSCVDTPLPRLISALTKLGDHLFVEAESPEFEKLLLKSTRIKKVVPRSATYPSLYAYHTKKRGLDLARYTQAKYYSGEPRYSITSSPYAKEFYKEGLEYPLKWIHGINLVTFVMFYGVYPTDAILRKQFLAFRQSHEEHNDLVIGNMILKGTKLYPIDMADSRRDADLYQCITTALRYFRKGNTRLKDPQVWIDGYYEDIV